ncbi:unnamed protein product [Paramecium pentaurelia]|uniref:Uncharacterized protein n=1 Tax=Paramecium pentaurelia TaxID=43138 RepID=A0A8S1SXE7_9CILI|nr:unnamed protein product [Paramecium pentaurelia]
MKYQLSPPSEVTVEMKQILNIIDLFDLDQLQRLLNHKNIFQKNQYLQQYLLNKIDYELENIVTEIQKNPVYDCTQLLKSIYDLMMITEIYWNGFLSYDHVINIIQYTDKLIVQDYCFSILINIHDSQFYEKNSKRIKQLIIIFQEHVNYLSSQKIELFDFYIQDPIKISFDIEYLEPTELDKSYEDLQKDEQNPTIISNQFKLRKILIEDDNQISALDSSRKLLNIQNQHFTPLLDIVKQRIIIKRGLQNNPQETKKIVILLHFKSIKLSKILNKFYEVNMYPFENYLKLFHKKIIDPSILIMLIDELKEKSDLDCFNNSEEIIKQLLQDVLSMKHKKQIQQYQGYPLEYNNLQIIDNICVKNESIVFANYNFLRQQTNAASQIIDQSYSTNNFIINKKLNTKTGF